MAVITAPVGVTKRLVTFANSMPPTPSVGCIRNFSRPGSSAATKPAQKCGVAGRPINWTSKAALYLISSGLRRAHLCHHGGLSVAGPEASRHLERPRMLLPPHILDSRD